MAYEMVMPYHLHMPSYFLETFTEYPRNKGRDGKGKDKKDKQQKSRECPPAFFQNRTINSITNLSCSDSFAKDSLS